jgi:hypothetical protein
MRTVVRKKRPWDRRKCRQGQRLNSRENARAKMQLPRESAIPLQNAVLAQLPIACLDASDRFGLARNPLYDYLRKFFP